MVVVRKVKTMKKIFIVLFFLWTMLPHPQVQAALISKQQEINMGKDVAAQLENQYGLVHDDELQDRINRIGQNLVQYCGRKDLNYTFKVLNSQDVNAMACPGGFIYVFKGLIDLMPSDDELAGVIGHEIGHIVKRHTVHQVEKQLALSLLTIIAAAGSGDAGAGLVLASTTSQALMAGYSRHDEGEADMQGIDLTEKAGYNPYSIYITMCKLDDLSKEKSVPDYGIFASHPDTATRKVKALKALEPLHITPIVTMNADGSWTVSDTNWRFVFNNGAGSDKPEYRARLMAGAMYVIKQHKPIDETHFITADSDNYSDVYYENTKILRVFQQDCPPNVGFSDYAATLAAKLQQWAVTMNKPAVVIKQTVDKTMLNKTTVHKQGGKAA